MIAVTLLTFKYWQKLDVCILILKNRKLKKQQGQLISYFLNQKDVIIIY
jgi:hypothetical protein